MNVGEKSAVLYFLILIAWSHQNNVQQVRTFHLFIFLIGFSVTEKVNCFCKSLMFKVVKYVIYNIDLQLSVKNDFVFKLDMASFELLKINDSIVRPLYTLVQ